MTKATQQLQEVGQSLWLDNITRELLTSGTLRTYIQEYSITGLTSNPTIFDHAIKNSDDYDQAIGEELPEGKSGEALFFDLALEDLRQAADLKNRFALRLQQLTDDTRQLVPSPESPALSACQRQGDTLVSLL